MIVVLTEKPSVARDISAFLGANARHEGYREGNGYQVTWAYGHLVELKEPEDYDSTLKRWTLASLPIVPDRSTDGSAARAWVVTHARSNPFRTRAPTVAIRHRMTMLPRRKRNRNNAPSVHFVASRWRTPASPAT